MTGLRALTRLALRECRRRPWRSLLVVALIALPTAGAVFVSTWMHTAVSTPEEQVTEQYGQADLVITMFGVQPGQRAQQAARVRAFLAGRSNWRSIAFQQGQGLVAADSGRHARARVGLFDVPLSDPLSRGIFTLTDGTAPTSAAEVAVAGDVAVALDVRVGDRLKLIRPDRSLLVTGILAGGGWYSRAVVGPGIVAEFSGPEVFLVDIPPGTENPPLPSGIQAVAQTRAQVQSNAASNSRYNETLLLYLFGGLGMAAFGLIVSSALAIGARRQLRALGLIGATGGSPRNAGLLILLQGVVLGTVGAAVGIGVGIGAAVAARPWVERYTEQHEGPLNVQPRDCLVIGVFAVVVAIAAAWSPARLAARTSVQNALGGRRPLSTLGLRVPSVGLVVSALGCMMLGWAVASGPRDRRTVTATVGTALIIGGLVICSPYLVGLLERVASRASGTFRLAARTVARQRSRTGPTVAAIMAAGALAVAVSTVVLSTRGAAASLPVVPDDVVELQASATSITGATAPLGCPEITEAGSRLLRAALPDLTMHCFTFAQGLLRSEGTTDHALAIVAPQDLASIGAGRYGADLARGRAVFVSDGVTPPRARLLSGAGTNPRPPVEVVSANLARAWPFSTSFGGGIYLVSPTTAKRLGASTTGTGTLAFAKTMRPLSDAQRDAVDRLGTSDPGAQLSTADRDVFLFFQLEPRQSRLTDVQFLTYAVILPAALVLALLTALIGLALTAAETRDEQAMIVAVGAGPGHRRRQNAWQAILVVGLGAILAIPGGLVPAAIVLHANGRAVSPPWLILLTLAIGLPLLTAVGAAVLTRGRLSPLIRRSV